MFIGARGSGEKATKDTRGMGAPVFYMAQRLKGKVKTYGETMGTLPVSYSADSVDELVPSKPEIAAMIASGAGGSAALYYHRHLKPYAASIDDGINRTIDAVRTELSNCPEAELVLAGYSQGAMAVRQAELRLEREGDQSVDAIGGTLLLGDGDRAPNSAAKLIGGARSAGKGVRVYLHGVRGTEVAEPETTVEICAFDDIVCDFSLHIGDGSIDWYKQAAHTHSAYLDLPQRVFLDQSVDWLAREMGLVPGARASRAHAQASQALPELNAGYEPEVRPETFSGWTGDGSQVLGGPSDNPPHGFNAGGSFGKIRWLSWGSRRAVGVGVVWYDDCNPSCGDGHWVHDPQSRAHAYRVRNGLFTRVSLKKRDLRGRVRRMVLRYTSPYPPQWSW